MTNQSTTTKVNATDPNVRTMDDIIQSLQAAADALEHSEFDDEIVELPLPLHPTVREQHRSMERRGAMKWIATIAALLIALIATGQPTTPNESPVGSPIAPANSLTSPIRGEVTAVFVEPGEIVKSGQLLLTFDSQELELRRIRLLQLSTSLEAEYSKALDEGNVQLIRHLTQNITVVDKELAAILRLMEKSLVCSEIDAKIDDNFRPAQLVGRTYEQHEPLLQLNPLTIQ
jgi:biotin carboxyl carrier protein